MKKPTKTTYYHQNYIPFRNFPKNENSSDLLKEVSIQFWGIYWAQIDFVVAVFCNYTSYVNIQRVQTLYFSVFLLQWFLTLYQSRIWDHFLLFSYQFYKRMACKIRKDCIPTYLLPLSYSQSFVQAYYNMSYQKTSKKGSAADRNTHFWTNLTFHHYLYQTWMIIVYFDIFRLKRNNYLVIILLLMSVKSFQELPFETLFKLAQQKYQSLQYEQAEYYYELAYKKNPQDQMLILCYSNLLKATDNHEKAKKLLQRSIAQIPTGTYKRYMELADIYEGVKSIQTFEKGIQIAQGCLSNPFKSNYSGQQIKRDIAQAYASIAQVCLTDLLEQKEAESKCIEAMEKGFKIDSSCIDIRVQKANYLMWKDDFETAKTQLVELHKWIKQQREQYDTEVVSTIAKYLIEVEQFQKSSQLFQKLHEDSSNQVETIYMLAYCAFKQGKWTICDEYIEEYDEKLKDKKVNGEIIDEQIQEAVAELKIQLSKKRKDIEQTGEDEQQWMDVEDDDDFQA